METRTEIELGQFVVIYSEGVPQAVGKCTHVGKKQARISSGLRRFSGSYSLKTGAMVGENGLTAVAISEQEAVQMRQEVEDRHQREADEREAQRDREARAAYDALPESVKLSRSMKWLCDCESEQTIAGAPIEHLRGIIAWAKERGLTTE